MGPIRSLEKRLKAWESPQLRRFRRQTGVEKVSRGTPQLVVPPDLVDYVSATLSVTSRHAPLLEQAVLCDFITEGHFSRHLRRMREVYAERLSTLL